MSIEIAEKLGNKELLSICHYNLGTIYAKTEGYESALNYYLKAKKNIIESGNKNFIATIYGTIGTTNLRLGNNKVGNDFIEKSFKIAKEVNCQNIMVINYRNMAEIYSEQGKHKLANESYKA